MTNLEALGSLTEYENTNLFTKILLDHNIDATETYTSSNAFAIDLALIDICKYLLTHPNIKEGNMTITYSPGALNAMIRSLIDKNWADMSTAEKEQYANVSGANIW